MDGSASAFLYDPPFLSKTMDDHGGGILYMEDFDYELRTKEPPPDLREPVAIPLLTQADLDLAREEGRVEGLQSALADATHTRVQLETAALQSLGDSLVAARGVLERVATQHAAECVRAVLAMLLAALPATMGRHGGAEIESMLAALLPGLSCEPELRVRTHPDQADMVREHLAEKLPSTGVVLSVVADVKLKPGDVAVAWQQGQARRDCKALWNAVRAAVASIDLPSIEELCVTNGS